MVKYCIYPILLIIFYFIPYNFFAEEYWSFFTHKIDKDNFDDPPYMFGLLTEEKVKLENTYTIVERDEENNIIEAMNILNAEPNFYYTYFSYTI